MFAPPLAKTQTKAATSSKGKLTYQRSRFVARPFDVSAVERAHPLQPAVGNQATLRLLSQQAGTEAARPASAKSPPTVAPLPGILQAKLEVGAVNDPLEHEADRIAEHVMRMPEPGTAASLALSGTAPVIERTCSCGGSCDKCQAEQSGDEDGHVQMKPAGAAAGHTSAPPIAPPIVHEVLRSPGQPLDAATRAFFEPRFGYGFDKVRVHTDTAAHQSARAVNARAYTVGHHIVFGAGQHAPSTAGGTRLLAHELTHVLQQGAGEIPQTGPRQGLLRSSEANVRLQRQPCRKEDDHIVTGALPEQLPDIKCEPSAQPLATIRAVPGVPQTILGVTSPVGGSLEVNYREARANRCKATIISSFSVSFDNFMYTAEGTYDDGVEVGAKGSPCAGKRIPKKLKITKPMADKLKAGEAEHCEDAKLAFALSLGKYNQAVNDLAGEYCPGGPPRKEGPPCQEEFAKRFQDRTGVAFDQQEAVAKCLFDKSKLRDDKGNKPFAWHDIQSEPHYDGCNSVTYVANPNLSPEIDRHPSSEIVKLPCP